jgi:protein tyrosine phosphatase
MQELDAWAVHLPDESVVEDTLDLPTLVHSLRQQRKGMVQSPQQYRFIYEAMAEEIAERVEAGAAR